MAKLTGIKKIVYYALYPFYGYLDSRFHDLLAQFREQDRRLEDLGRAIEMTRNEMATDAQVTRREMATDAQVTRREMAADAQVTRNEMAAEAQVTRKEMAVDAQVTTESIAALGRLTARLRQELASEACLNAAGGLWFNPPAVHERIIEVPFVLAESLKLPVGSAILDLGCAERMIDYSLANLGYRVTALAQRPCPLAHPHLHTVVGDVGSWEPPAQCFDAVIALASVELRGLPVFGSTRQASDVDRRVISRIAGWLKPGGKLLLTVHLGGDEETSEERFCRPEQLATLLEGWKVTSSRLFWRSAPTVWEEVEAAWATPWPREGCGVALVVAEPVSPG